MRKLVFGIFMVVGLVSVGFSKSPYYLKMADEKAQGVKEIVAELEDLEKNGKLPYKGKSPLQEGKLFLEFVEKVKQSKEKECIYAIDEVMGDLDNESKYRNYTWSDTNRNGFRCLNLGVFYDDMKETRIELKKKGIELKSFGSK